MNAILAAAVIFVVFTIGDMISAKTKAIVSMLLVASVLFLAGFWTGIFPTTMFADSTLLSMAGLLVTMLLVHLGTTIKLRDFGAQCAPSSLPPWPASPSPPRYSSWAS